MRNTVALPYFFITVHSNEDITGVVISETGKSDLYKIASIFVIFVILETILANHGNEGQSFTWDYHDRTNSAVKLWIICITRATTVQRII